jgi:hypothetical protein
MHMYMHTPMHMHLHTRPPHLPLGHHGHAAGDRHHLAVGLKAVVGQVDERQ